MIQKIHRMSGTQKRSSLTHTNTIYLLRISVRNEFELLISTSLYEKKVFFWLSIVTYQHMNDKGVNKNAYMMAKPNVPYLPA